MQRGSGKGETRVNLASGALLVPKTEVNQPAVRVEWEQEPFLWPPTEPKTMLR